MVPRLSASRQLTVKSHVIRSGLGLGLLAELVLSLTQQDVIDTRESNSFPDQIGITGVKIIEKSVGLQTLHIHKIEDRSNALVGKKSIYQITDRRRISVRGVDHPERHSAGRSTSLCDDLQNFRLGAVLLRRTRGNGRSAHIESRRWISCRLDLRNPFGDGWPGLRRRPKKKREKRDEQSADY